MKAPNNFIFVSSLNARLYRHRDNTFTRYVPQSFLNNKCILYHENSFDQSNNNESIDLRGGMKSNPLNNRPILPNINSHKSAQMITERSNPPS